LAFYVGHVERPDPSAVIRRQRPRRVIKSHDVTTVHYWVVGIVFRGERRSISSGDQFRYPRQWL